MKRPRKSADIGMGEPCGRTVKPCSIEIVAKGYDLETRWPEASEIFDRSVPVSARMSGSFETTIN